MLTEPSKSDRYIQRQHIESSAAAHPSIDGVIKVVELTGGFTGREPLTL
ncbi:hypothetical protein [Nesterenkonia pannonica]|nr:hypothetical protein [Nesterenkonia pannonica]